ncbi:MAG: hypothetical protein ACRCY9_21735, partial [Phycicoccus sp.]
ALLPRYTGRVDALAGLRANAVDAVREAVTGTEQVVLVAATDREPRHAMAPLGQRVGEHLLSLASSRPDDVALVSWDAPRAECRGKGAEIAADEAASALVVVADGSARRSAKAPGHLDERAFVVDEALVAALRDADPDALLALDPALAADLLVHGRAPLQVAAAAMMGKSTRGGETGTPTAGFRDNASPQWRCDRLEVPDPFGVLHLVALLRPAGRPPAAPRQSPRRPPGD